MPTQIPLSFPAGLLEQFPEFMDCVRDSVYGCGRPFKQVAADMDMSASELSRRLNDDPKDLPFQLRRLPDLMEATRDTRPAQWLALKYLADAQSTTSHAMRELAALVPTLTTLINNAGLVTSAPARKGRR